MKYEQGESFALHMDAVDPLNAYRSRFYMPKRKNGDEVLYFCGNSLGLQPRSVSTVMERELTDWATLAVEGHFKENDAWITYHDALGASMAEIVGAKPEETVVMNTLTVNLHLMMVSFYRPTAQRFKILMEYSPFPSDTYAVRSQVAFHGYDPNEAIIELKPEDGSVLVATEAIEALLEKEGDSIALVMLGGVNYYTGQVYDMKRITDTAHKMGCIVGFDLAHGAGNVLLKLHDWNVDFAVWCTYKYLNAGPGAVAACFVHERHGRNSELPRFAGWWGHNKERRFLMENRFNPIEGADGWQLSNPPILALTGLKASLEIFAQTTMETLVQKSRLLTGYLEFLLDRLNNNAISIITPRAPEQRGCQLSIRVKGSDKSLFNRICAQGVIADWREPDAIRVAPVPLYNSFHDVYRFINVLQSVLSSKDKE